MFLHEHGLEISWIYAGIITSSLFRVDIPLSSKSIRFGTKASGMEMDGEVELAEEFGPSDLVVGEQFSGRKILKIVMICHHINQGWRSLKVMTPDFECFKNHEQFFVMVLCGDLSEAIDGVAKSDDGDVGVTWLQLMCCALPKTSVSLIYLRMQNVGGGRSWVRGVILGSDGGRLSQGHSEDEG